MFSTDWYYYLSVAVSSAWSANQLRTLRSDFWARRRSLSLEIFSFFLSTDDHSILFDSLNYLTISNIIIL